MHDVASMFTHPAKWLMGLGLVLIVLAISLVMFDPVNHVIGFYPKAKTGGIIGSGFGLVLLFCGAMTLKGSRGALWTGLLICLLAVAGFFMQGKKFVKQARGPKPELAYSATIISLMSAASFITLLNVARSIRRLP